MRGCLFEDGGFLTLHPTANSEILLYYLYRKVGAELSID